MTTTIDRPKGLDADSHVQTNYYRCECGNTWEDDWDCGCDDECAECGREVSPFDSIPVDGCDCCECVETSGHDSHVPATGADRALNEGNDVDPHKIDLEASRAERIAFASTGDDGKQRWTDLAVYYLHQPPSSARRWLSEAIGQSNVPGERPRMRRLNVGSLDRALKLFEDSDIGVIVSEQARDWAETAERATVGVVSVGVVEFDKVLNDAGIKTSIHRFGDRPAGSPALIVTENREPMTTIGRTWVESSDLWDGARESDAEALEWLYGERDTSRSTFGAMLAKDFDLPARTVQTALKEGTPIRIPLRSILRFVDRAAFRAWRAANREADNA